MSTTTRQQQAQMIVEGLAIAAFNVMAKQTGDPTLASLLDYVLQDEGRHVNFGYFALRACDAIYARDEHTGFRSITTVWDELGYDGTAVWRDTVTTSATTKMFNRFLFSDVLIPRLGKLGLIGDRVAPRYREIGLIEAS
jgi:hypothetical protein